MIVDNKHKKKTNDLKIYKISAKRGIKSKPDIKFIVSHTEDKARNAHARAWLMNIPENEFNCKPIDRLPLTGENLMRIILSELIDLKGERESYYDEEGYQEYKYYPTFDIIRYKELMKMSQDKLIDYIWKLHYTYWSEIEHFDDGYDSLENLIKIAKEAVEREILERNDCIKKLKKEIKKRKVVINMLDNELDISL